MNTQEQGEMGIYRAEDGAARIEVRFKDGTAWLTQGQMAELFGTSLDNVAGHIRRIYGEGELDEAETCREIRQVGQKETRQGEREEPLYSLDLALAVGYRVKPAAAARFRRWATGRPEEHPVRGAEKPGAPQEPDVLQAYSAALALLDDYDHQRIRKSDARGPSVPLSYEECRRFIDGMAFAADSALFGNEKDGSFKSAVGAIGQSFGGRDVYPSAREKAANLLYLVAKNHGFSDGNKRIAAALFLYYLNRNGLLFREDGSKRIADHTLVALTVMIAESRPAEKDTMVALAMAFLS